EEAFGVDLVEAQLLVAAGKSLPWKQEDLEARRHGIEMRIYAEDPYNNNLPSPGTLLVYRTPKGPGVRVDDGVVERSEVSSLYDPMVAKLIVSGQDRDHAIRRGLTALTEYEIEGIRTNLDLLAQVLQCAPFREGSYTTAILSQLPPLELPEVPDEPSDVARVLAALAVHEAAPKAASTSGGDGGEGGWSPWALDGLRRTMGGST
ncbi:MAG: biotin carboxylase, partial [Myxococcota bacterium]|nr:biotin carboxylase [Myxococcota bacterium]